MKKALIIIFMLAGIGTYAQNKNAKATMEVDGICLMCKSRIEKAALNTKGVKSAVWNLKTHQLSLIFNEGKTNTDTIQANVLRAGHDANEAKATLEAYNSVHDCCKYRDEDVIDDHQEKDGGSDK
jgi:mercuric ion binding protein